MKINEHLDDDVRDIVTNMPADGAEETTWGCFNHVPLNASVFYNSRRGVLEIWPAEGGWLGVNIEHLVGDVAPGH